MKTVIFTNTTGTGYAPGIPYKLGDGVVKSYIEQGKAHLVESEPETPETKESEPGSPETEKKTPKNKK